MDDSPDWDPVRALAHRVLNQGIPLELTDDVRSLLRRTAQEVAISDADTALQTEAGATDLLREAMRRIKDGSWRLMRALHRMYQHKRAGDFDSARQEMREVLAAEVVPFYRDVAAGQLEDLDDEP